MATQFHWDAIHFGPPAAFRFGLSVLLTVFLIIGGGRQVAAQPPAVPTQDIGAEEEHERRFAAGLRKRRLFQLCETFCRQRLALDSITERHRAEMTIALLRSLADHALNLPPEQRPPLWKQARETASLFVVRHRKNPRIYLVMAQDALTSLANGVLARQEAEVSGRDDLLQVARQHLRSAATAIRALDEELNRAIPRAQGANPRNGELTSAELISLRNNMLFQLGRTYRNQALCYKAASADQVNSLTRAISELSKPLTQLAPTDLLRQSIGIEAAVCYRLLGELTKSRQALANVEQLQPGAENRLHVRAELIRLELAGRRLEAARRLLLEPREIDGEVSGPLDYAHLEVVVALLRQADLNKVEADAKRWREQAVNLVRFIEETHGAYWGRRGSSLLVRVAGAGRGVGNLDILRRTALEFYSKGQLPAAVAAYEKAAAFAVSVKNEQASFDLLCAAAAIEQKQKNMPACISKLRGACRDHKQVKAAAETHLSATIGAFNLSATDQKWLADYESMLREHISLWPTSATANEARARLASRLQAQSKFAEALRFYRGVTVDFAKFSAVMAATENCVQRQLATMSPDQSAYRMAVRDALSHFDRVVTGGAGRLPERWTAATRSAVTAGARLRLRHAESELRTAGEFLQAALQGQPAATPAWMSSARSLLIVVWARQGRTADAVGLLDQLANTSSRDLLTTLQGLSKLRTPGNKRSQKQLGELQLALTERLLAGQQLKPQSVPSVRRIRAQALADVGKMKESLTEFRKLVSEYPRDLGVQLGYARSLMAEGSKSSLETAAQRWRVIKRATRSRTEPWFEANYSLALAHYKLGDKARAKQLVQLLQATTDLSKTRYKDRIETLLRDAQR